MINSNDCLIIFANKFGVLRFNALFFNNTVEPESKNHFVSPLSSGPVGLEINFDDNTKWF